MKKIITMMLLVLSLVLVACTPSEEPPTTVPDVESIEFNMTSTTVAPGEHTLVAKALPEGSNQQIRFSIQGIVSGVSITGDKLNVGNAVEDGMKFTVVATSVYDPTIRATLEFTVVNVGVEVVEIRTEEELRAIHTNEGGLSLSYVLMNDIELTTPWTPIGIAEVETDSGQIIPGTPFNGIFNGNGFTISGILVESEEPLFNAGFFAQIGATAIVKNTTFEGIVNATGWSGGIAGINEGLIENVVSNVRVTVTGTSAGSLVSVNRGLIQYAYGIGKVVSETNPNTSGRSAGLVVANDGSMIEVYGDYQALETPNYTAFSPSTNPMYMLPTVDMKTSSTWASFDADVWYIENGTYPLLKHEGFVPPVIVPELGITIKNTELNHDVEVSSELQINAEVINPEGSEVIVYALKEAVAGVAISETGLVTFDITTIAANFSFTVVVTIDGTEVSAEKTFTGVYNPEIVDDTVYIETETQLLNLLAGQTNPDNLSKTFVLLNDIVLTSNWTAIGIAPNEDEGVVGVPFTGVFDGQGYKISGISMPGGGWNKGFFGYIGTTGVVKNTHFEGNIEANAWSGALAANNSGTIQDVVVDIEVYVWGNNGGAIVEHNHGLLKNIVVLGKAVSDSGPTAVGLVVTNFGTLENVFANADTVGTANLVSNGALADDGTHIISAQDFVKATTYANFDSAIWLIVDGQVPVLINEDTVLPETVVYIETEAELLSLLAGQVDPEALSKTYKLKNDIVLTSNWTAIGIAPNEDEGIVGVPFTGVFDGQGYKISGISMPGGGWNKGFFGYIGTTGVVKNTHFEGNLEANAWSGALAANNSGTIMDVVVDIEVYVWGSNGGAIVEHNHGLLKNIIVLGKAVSDGGPTVVGLVVTNFGTLEDVYANVDTVGTLNLVSFGSVADDGTHIISASNFVKAETYANFSSDVWTIIDGSTPVLKQA
ncbi:hypothetical protein [Acholeplasma laidlawii]|uniref:hypothetical protein n=1 Tax=Acholeplasma laidlawii TaxID=2148 RepID=UPI0021F77F78|nr:hypothetical protein [Acholeplasma laidlawii]